MSVLIPCFSSGCFSLCRLLPRRNRRRIVSLLGLLAVLTLSFVVQFRQCVSQDTDSGVNTRHLAATLRAATVRIETPNDLCSGVLVSSNGLILSVAHGVTAADRTVSVFLHDGRSFKGRVRFRNADLDVAAIQITAGPDERLPQPIALQRDISGPSVREQRPIVFACGYPARESSGQSPVLRMGRIEVQDRNAIRSSCVLTAGDSGGPLVNPAGRLIGLHRRIGLRRQVNVHIPVSVVRAAASRHGELTELKGVASSTARFDPRPSDQVLRELRLRTAWFYTPGEADPFLAGTWLTSSLVTTKLSELPTEIEMLTCGRAGETAVRFTKVAVDRQLDLVFVKLHESADATDVPTVPPIGVPDSTDLSVGSIVFGGSEASPGVVARTAHREIAVVARLGVELLIQSGNIYVEKVNPLDAAGDAELLPGDRLVKLGDADLKDLDDVADVLSNYQPGDRVIFDVERNEQKLQRIGRLTFPADSMLQRENFLDGRAGELSRRRTGFRSVIQHDVNLSPLQMGGPLVDRRGRCVGVNIARRGRESVLAIPIDRFSGFLTPFAR